METPAQKLYSLLAKFDTAMLLTQGLDLTQHARPLAVAKVEANCDVWFFTARSPEKIHEIKRDQKVLLLFQNGHQCYVSLSGRAELVSDHVLIAPLWKESGKPWFPDSVKDPNPIFIRVTSEGAEYWDVADLSGIKHFFAITKARITGNPLQINELEHHGRMTLKAA